MAVGGGQLLHELSPGAAKQASQRQVDTACRNSQSATAGWETIRGREL